jgi:hypothetical protein
MTSTTRYAVPVFGCWPWEMPANAVPYHRIRAIAAVTVERTPLFRVVGEPEPLDRGEVWFEDYPLSVDHDPAKYAPYTDLVRDGEDSGFGYGPYYLLEIV